MVRRKYVAGKLSTVRLDIIHNPFKMMILMKVKFNLNIQEHAFRNLKWGGSMMPKV